MRKGQWYAQQGANGHWYVKCDQDVVGSILIADCGIEGKTNAQRIASCSEIYEALANIKYAWDTKVDAKSRYYPHVQNALAMYEGRK